MLCVPWLSSWSLLPYLISGFTSSSISAIIHLISPCVCHVVVTNCWKLIIQQHNIHTKLHEKSETWHLWNGDTHTHTHRQHSDLVTTFNIFRDEKKLKCEIMISPWWLHLCLSSHFNFELVHQCCTERQYYGNYWIYNTKNAPWVTMTRDEKWKFSFFWHNSPQWARASWFTRFLDHTRCITVGRTPLDEWSARPRDLYLSAHNTHNRQTSMPLVRFQTTISAGEWLQTYALDHAATGTGKHGSLLHQILSVSSLCFLVQLIMYYCYENIILCKGWIHFL